MHQDPRAPRENVPTSLLGPMAIAPVGPRISRTRVALISESCCHVQPSRGFGPCGQARPAAVGFRLCGGSAGRKPAPRYVRSDRGLRVTTAYRTLKTWGRVDAR